MMSAEYQMLIINKSYNYFESSSTLTLGATTTDIDGLTSLVIDDITINGQTLSTTCKQRY